jgi:hypothetical protein
VNDELRDIVATDPDLTTVQEQYDRLVRFVERWLVSQQEDGPLLGIQPDPATLARRWARTMV